jgi:hypothetical protein
MQLSTISGLQTTSFARNPVGGSDTSSSGCRLAVKSAFVLDQNLSSMILTGQAVTAKRQTEFSLAARLCSESSKVALTAYHSYKF